MKKSSGEGTRVRKPPVPTLRSLVKILHRKLKYRQRSRLSPRAFTKVQKLCLVSADGNAHPSRSSRGGRNPGQSALSTRLWTLLQEFHFVVSWQRWTKPRGVPRLPVPGRLRLTEPKARCKGSDAGRVWVAGLRRWGQKCSGVEGMDALLHPTPGRCNLVTCISYLSTHFFFPVSCKAENSKWYFFPLPQFGQLVSRSGPAAVFENLSDNEPERGVAMANLSTWVPTWNMVLIVLKWSF